MNTARVVIVAVVAAVASACAESSSGPEPEFRRGIGAECVQGCLETDPFPNEPGIFLTSTVTAAKCISNQYSDYDQDGLGDRCEWDLSAAFAPTMNYYKFDDVRRQGYWAARPYGGRILIQYQLGYYLDLGVAENINTCSIAEIVIECDGHNGDSESVTLIVSYEVDTKHWLLTEARLSAHTGYNVVTGQPYAPFVGWTTKTGGSPVVWVSNKKHANYPTQQTCEDGGTSFGPLASFETCSGPRLTFRATSGSTRNMGSFSVKLLNCVSSLDPFYQDPPHPQECLWDRVLFPLSARTRFYGWQLDHGTSSSPIADRLWDDGFFPQ